MAAPPVALAAKELGLELLQVAGVNEPAAAEAIRAADPELPVLCAFGQLIGEELLAGPPILNVHPSLLPRWRGAAPVERAIMAGDAQTGVTIMRLTAGLDAGPMALQETVPIEPGDDFGSLSRRLAELGGELLVSALDRAATGELEFREQDDAAATYAEKIAAEDRFLDPRRPAIELERQVRALRPHIGARLGLADGSVLGVRAAEIDDGAQVRPGTLEAGTDRLLLGCKQGTLAITLVLPPGGREMTASDYLLGHSPPQLGPIGED
jgi:methionyl-tRNA formyltransferase